MTGLNLSTTTAVTFGANTGTITAADDSALTVTVPTASGVGTVPITVSTAGGTADGITYTYLANPELTALAPASGPTSGGNLVTLTGIHLASTEEVVFGPDAVHVGGQNASFTVISDTEIAAVAPPETAGPADVIVKSPGGRSSLLVGYTYLAGPTT
ncbi:IPT/TIG domain-containing protein [Streptomyces sp. NPDC079020]|uniref:IPT/TIG domain-containing protein n=1 Tax=Streptomyces sp. NPDC079020 TaxID=3365722 RepID=UPI0037D1F523